MEEETLGERIKRLREVRRLTQAELADVLAVSTKTISNWEKDRTDPRSSLGALREFFGRSFDQDLTPAATETPVDDVEAALGRSALHEWRKTALVGEYRRHLHEQQREEAG